MLSSIKVRTSKVLNPLTDLLARLGVKPNHLTLLGLVFGFLCAYAIYLGKLLLSAVLLILSGLMDVLDGALARNRGLVSDFGGVLDSVLDRYVDIAIFLALGFYLDWFLAVFAMSGALMVSYTRARAEKVVERCDVGIAERGERLILILIGLLFPFFLRWILLLVGVLSHITAIHRVLYTYKKLKRPSS